MTDLTDRKYVKRLPDAYAKAKESNNNKLLRLNDVAVEELYKSIDEVVDALELDNVEGAILDDYGEMLGTYRGKLNDRQYKAVIKATIAANISKGDYSSVMKGLSYIFNLPKGVLTVHEVENQICTAKLSDLPYSALLETGLTADQVKFILKKLLAVAIKVEESSFDGTFEFGTSHTEYDESKGFGNIAQSIGGYLGTVITGTKAVRTRMPQIKITPNVSLATSNNPVVINGETVQAGSGDPSPTNVRAISTDQKFYKEVVFTGNENISYYDSNGKRRFYYTVGQNIHPVAENNQVSPMICSHLKTATPTQTWAGAFDSVSFTTHLDNQATNIGIYIDEFNGKEAAELKVWLTQLYEAGTPLTVWFETREPTGEYYVCHSITDSDGNYRAYGEKMLGGAMYSGDSYDLKTGVETHTKAKIVLDGTQAGQAEYVEGGAKRYRITFANDDPYAPINPPTTQECKDGVISDYLPSQNAGTVWSGVQGISLEFHSTKLIQIHIDGCTTLEEYNAYLAANPLTVIYKLATPITYQHEPFYKANVSMKSATNGASIYYTTNGSTPTNSSQKYTAEFSVNADTEIKAIAYSYGLDQSKIADKSFIIP